MSQLTLGTVLGLFGFSGVVDYVDHVHQIMTCVIRVRYFSSTGYRL